MGANIISKRTVMNRVNEDGVILSSESYEKVKVGTEPLFVKKYFLDISKLFGLTLQIREMLDILCTQMQMGNNEVYITMGDKINICHLVGIYKKGTNEPSIATINNYIQVLIKRGILSRISTSKYLIDPLIFGRGEWKDIQKIRMCVEYSEDGRMVITDKYRKREDENNLTIQNNENGTKQE